MSITGRRRKGREAVGRVPRKTRTDRHRQTDSDRRSTAKRYPDKPRINSGGRTPKKGKEFFAPPGAEKGSTVNPEYRSQPIL